MTATMTATHCNTLAFENVYLMTLKVSSLLKSLDRVRARTHTHTNAHTHADRHTHTRTRTHTNTFSPFHTHTSHAVPLAARPLPLRSNDEILKREALDSANGPCNKALQCVAVCCSVLQCVAVCDG